MADRISARPSCLTYGAYVEFGDVQRVESAVYVTNVSYHSKSLYMIVKKTCRNKLTAFISTASRYSHASPDIIETTRVRNSLDSDGGVGR